MNIYKVLGKRIREIRIKSNITQERLAESSGISSNFISQIERGRNKCSLDTIYKLSQALNTPMSKLFNFAASPVAEKDAYKKRINMLMKNLSPRDKKLLMDITEDVYGKLKRGKRKK